MTNLNNSQINAVIKSSLDCIVIINSKGVIIEFNPAAETCFLFKRDEVIGLPIEDTIIPDKYIEAHKLGFAHFVKTGIGPALNKRIEIEGRKKNNEIFPIELTIVPYNLDNQLYFSAYIRDLTEKRKVDKQIKEYGEKITKENSIWQMIGTIFELNLQTEYKTENELLFSILSIICNQLNWEIAHIYKVTIKNNREILSSAKLWYSKQIDSFTKFIKVTAQTDFEVGEGLPGRVYQSQTAEWIPDIANYSNFPRKNVNDGIEIHAGLGIPLIVNKKVYGVIELFSQHIVEKDDSILRALELVSHHLGKLIEKKILEDRERNHLALLTQKSKLSLVGELASGVAHEINNPLTIISGLAYRLERPNLTQLQLKEISQHILQTTVRISKIVKGLMLFSGNSDHEDSRPKSLKDLLEEVLNFCSNKLASLKIKLTIEGDLDTVIHIKAMQISQVMLNIINNAKDAIRNQENSWIKIIIEKEGSTLLIKIIDSGTGIPDEVAEQIMNPFFTTKEIGQGTGLGLSMSKGLVENNGGSLYLDKSNANTCFVVQLPLKEAGVSTKISA